MARSNEWLNADGLRQGFGARDSFNQFDQEVHTLGRVRQAEVHFVSDNIGSFADGTAPQSKDFEIPARSVIVGSTLRVVETVTGLTSLDVGLKDYDDGASNDPNGLHAGVTSFTQDDVDVGAGALIGTAVDEDQAISVTPTGTMTAGEVVVLIEYIEPQPSQAAPGIIVGEI